MQTVTLYEKIFPRLHILAARHYFSDMEDCCDIASEALLCFLAQRGCFAKKNSGISARDSIWCKMLPGRTGGPGARRQKPLLTGLSAKMLQIRKLACGRSKAPLSALQASHSSPPSVRPVRRPAAAEHPGRAMIKTRRNRSAVT